MVHEYKKLSQSFEEVKAKKESHATKAELVSSREIQATLIKLSTENGKLRSRTKFQTMNFVKSNTGQPEEEKSESPITAKPQIWQGQYCGMGYTAPEKPKESWLKKRVEHMQGQPKSGGRKPGQFSKAFMKDREYKPK
ncbi:Myb-like DNA-binding protein [Dorcoceras hygrometricum]|uniref:Myb-like DNA-binding protein n=1 Tax=Dorcoceras hygrometricum TaxID=472368 RepID=A0A2Z7B857_9LAMI|nr:Myb-like DNA-binding protein [Dorcoceras hygrometricum]